MTIFVTTVLEPDSGMVKYDFNGHFLDDSTMEHWKLVHFCMHQN